MTTDEQKDNKRKAPLGFSKAVGFLGTAVIVRFVLLFVLCLFIAFMVSPHYSMNVDRYGLGEYTTKSVRAPFDFTVVNEKETEKKREEAIHESLPIADLDTNLPLEIRRRAADAFRLLQEAFEEADALALVPEDALKKLSKTKKAARIALAKEKANKYLDETLAELLPEFEKSMNVELTPKVKYTLRRGKAGAQQLEGFLKLIDAVYRNPVPRDIARVRQTAQGDRKADDAPLAITIIDLANNKERVFADFDKLMEPKAIHDGLSALARETLPDLTPGNRRLIRALVSPQVKPNLIMNIEETAKRKQAAAETVIPISITFHKNQLIIGEGQPVNEQTILALSHLSELRRPKNYYSKILGTACLVYLLVFLGFWIADINEDRFVVTDRDFVFIASSLVLFVLLLRIWLFIAEGIAQTQPGISELVLLMIFPIAAGAMLCRQMLNFEIALLQAAIIAILAGLVSDFGLYLTTYAFVVGLVGAHTIGGATHRGDVLRAGLLTGGISMAGAVCLLLLTVETINTTNAMAIPAAFLGGILASLAVLALGPIAESLFGYTTNITLLEFANYEHPLLKRIMTETPGTFQHSVSIGILAEASAVAVGGNALLMRVGALYHDAGKTENPRYFVENQGKKNYHDDLPPDQSAKIILQHVTDGVRLVKKHRLGNRIADFVSEHHGTGFVKYFLAKARETGQEVNADDYRYPGPKPRSKETGILMIADQIEATSRTMNDATEDEFREMIIRTIDRIRAEKQLDECPLTLADLAATQDAMVQVLAGLHHQRIKYPDDKPAPPKKKSSRWLRAVR